jgi:hypothetical protein
VFTGVDSVELVQNHETQLKKRPGPAVAEIETQLIKGTGPAVAGIENFQTARKGAV